MESKNSIESICLCDATSQSALSHLNHGNLSKEKEKFCFKAGLLWI